MSYSVRPHRLQATRLPRPWDSPGKNKGVGCISFSNAWKWKVKVKSLSPVRLFATPWTVAYQAPPSMGFSRQEYWSGLPFSFSRESSQPRDQTWVSRISGRRLNLWATRTYMTHIHVWLLEKLALTRRTFVGKVMSLLFNMLSRLVMAFLPRSKRLLISWL